MAFVLEQLDDNAKGDRITDHVRTQLMEESNALTVKIQEAETAISNTRVMMETATHTAQRVTENAATATLSIQAAITSVTTMASQLSETTTTYRDAMTRAATLPQNAPTTITMAPTLNARVHAWEGIKQQQVLVDAVTAGTQILTEMNNVSLTKRANEILDTIGTEHTHAIVSARWLANSGILFELDSEEVAT